MTRIAYLDSSAIAKLVMPEPEHEILRAFLASYPNRATSIIGVIEVGRAVSRRDASHGRDLPDLWSRINVIPLDDRVAARAASIDPPALRTLDAVHLATALELSTDLEVFVTYDMKLADAATRQGLPVESPGGKPV